MSDAATATEKAIFVALTAAALDWPLYQHVPQDTPPPVHIIGDAAFSALEVKAGDPDRTGTVTILTVFQGEQRKPVTERQAIIAAALDGVTLIEGDFRIHVKEDSQRAELMEDGETYLGTSTFSVWALHV